MKNKKKKIREKDFIDQITQSYQRCDQKPIFCKLIEPQFIKKLDTSRFGVIKPEGDNYVPYVYYSTTTLDEKYLCCFNNQQKIFYLFNVIEEQLLKKIVIEQDLPNQSMYFTDNSEYLIIELQNQINVYSLTNIQDAIFIPKRVQHQYKLQINLNYLYICDYNIIFSIIIYDLRRKLYLREIKLQGIKISTLHNQIGTNYYQFNIQPINNCIFAIQIMNIKFSNFHYQRFLFNNLNGKIISEIEPATTQIKLIEVFMKLQLIKSQLSRVYYIRSSIKRKLIKKVWFLQPGFYYKEPWILTTKNDIIIYSFIHEGFKVLNNIVKIHCFSQDCKCLEQLQQDHQT